jgi:Na+/pantothenate symporter
MPGAYTPGLGFVLLAFAPPLQCLLSILVIAEKGDCISIAFTCVTAEMVEFLFSRRWNFSLHAGGPSFEFFWKWCLAIDSSNVAL